MPQQPQADRPGPAQFPRCQPAFSFRLPLAHREQRAGRRQGTGLGLGRVHPALHGREFALQPDPLRQGHHGPGQRRGPVDDRPHVSLPFGRGTPTFTVDSLGDSGRTTARRSPIAAATRCRWPTATISACSATRRSRPIPVSSCPTRPAAVDHRGMFYRNSAVRHSRRYRRHQPHAVRRRALQRAGLRHVDRCGHGRPSAAEDARSVQLRSRRGAVLVLGHTGDASDVPPHTPNSPGIHVDDFWSQHPLGVNFLFVDGSVQSSATPSTRGVVGPRNAGRRRTDSTGLLTEPRGRTAKCELLYPLPADAWSCRAAGVQLVAASTLYRQAGQNHFCGDVPVRLRLGDLSSGVGQGGAYVRHQRPMGTDAIEGLTPGKYSIAVISRDPSRGRSTVRGQKPPNPAKVGAVRETAASDGWFPLPGNFQSAAHSGLDCTLDGGEVVHDIELK